MKKKICSILIVSMILTLIPVVSFAENSSIDNFQKNTEYIPGKFYDVKAGSWYEENVNTVCAYGLMTGQSESRFNPEGSLTFAEAIALASRLHSIYHNNGYNFRNATPWYDDYVRYAEYFGIMESHPP